MSLAEFQTKVFGDNGLARGNRWVVTLYPPRGLTATGNALSNLIPGGNKVSINLPVFDAIDNAVNALNDLSIDLGGININTNFAIPTLGYALGNLNERDRTLNLFCAGVSTPSKEIESFDWKEFGERRHMGFNHIYEDLQLTYYCSSDLREKMFFEQWQDVIFNNVQGATAYYDDMVSRCDVAQYDWNWRKKTAEYRYFECWPSSVSGFQLDHENSDVLKLVINLKFRRQERIK